MTCETMRERFADYWSGSLEASERFAFESHLSLCEACRGEAKELSGLWAKLGMLDAPEPGTDMRARFHQMLDVYEQGIASGARKHKGFSFSEALERWWPKRPALQFALSMGLAALGVLGGVAGGYGLKTSGAAAPATGEVSQLRGEIQSMRQMVTLSLLQQQSASQRLQGVNWSYRVEQSDMEVLSALLFTVNHDANTNVRLSAVDALRSFSGSPITRKGAVQAIAKQESPLVQIALIDMVTEWRDPAVVPVLKALVSDSKTNQEVKQRAQWALGRMQ